MNELSIKINFYNSLVRSNAKALATGMLTAEECERIRRQHLYLIAKLVALNTEFIHKVEKIELIK